jgi:GTP-binding protein HflX
VLLTDTVGFIRKLPHHLINAFKSTLEEAKYADMIVHVVDAANPDKDRQMEIVYETLEELGVTDKPVITLFNKWDVAGEMQTQVPPRDFRADRVLYVSARTGLGLEDFKDVLGDMLRQGNVYFEHVYGFDEAGKVQVIRRFGQLVSEEYTGEGIRVAGYLPKEYLKKAGIDEA